jgi:cyanophycinase
MSSNGPVALLGGHEHRRGTAAIERAILDELGAHAPQVTVLPVASAPRQVGMVASLARNHWARLGARVRIAVPDRRGADHAMDAVAGADVIVLTGGVPNRLVAALGASPVWDLVVERWRQGAAISGASAGAMSLFAWRLALYPPNPLELIAGLGALDGWVAAPHFSRFRADRWAGPVTRRFGELGVLGIDERTALVGRGGRFTVVGDGLVTLLREGRPSAHRQGDRLELDLGEGRLPAVEGDRRIRAA